MAYFLPPKVNVSLPPLSQMPASSAPRSYQQPPSRREGSRALSWSKKIRNILPSQRAERGGTLRRQGYWKHSDPDFRKEMEQLRHHATDSRRSGRSVAADSDKILRWNTARDLSTSHHRATSSLNKPDADHDAQPSPNTADNQWNWPPVTEPVQWSFANEPSSFPNGRANDRSSLNQQELADIFQFPVPSLEIGHESQTHLSIAAKKEARRRRQHLKASGDYLGVQGANPKTGQLDIITPTDSERSISQDATHRQDVSQAAPGSIDHWGKDPPTTRIEPSLNINIQAELEKQRKLDLEKIRMKDLTKSVKWRRHTKQWSSAQEPELSPIAQSQTGSRATSGQQSLHRVRDQASHSNHAKLIDLSCPPNLGHHSAGVSPEDQSATPGSCVTIIRTPHRQSLATFSSAAQELFENGISFDEFHSANLKVPHNPVNSLPQLSQEKSLETIHSENMSSQVIPKALSSIHTSIPVRDKKVSTSTLGVNKLESFLGLPTSEQVDPGGPSSKNLKTLSSFINYQIQQDQITKPTGHGSMTAVGRELSPLHTNVHHERAMAGTSRLHPGNNLPNKTARKRFMVPKTEFLYSRRFIREFVQRLPRQSKEVMINKTMKEFHMEVYQHALRAADSLKKGGQAQSQEQESLGPKPQVGEHQAVTDPTCCKLSSKYKIQKDMAALRRQIARLDSLEPGMLKKSPTQSMADHEWSMGTMTDLHHREDQARKGGASIPIIITIGSDQPMSEQHASLKRQRGTKHVLKMDAMNESSRLMKGPHVMDASAVKSNNYLTNRSLNTSANSSRVIQRKAANVISGIGQSEMKNHDEGTLVTCTTETPFSENQCVVIPPSLPHTSVSTTTRVQDVKWDENYVRPKRNVKGKKRADKSHILRTPRDTQPTEALMANISTAKGNAHLWKPMEGATEDKVEHKTHQLMLIPGGYPTPLDAGEGIAGRSKGELIPQDVLQLERGGRSFRRTKSIISATLYHSRRALSLYWRAVKPICDPQSQFWLRNTRREMTMMDAVLMAAALPGAILATTAFV